MRIEGTLAGTWFSLLCTVWQTASHNRYVCGPLRKGTGGAPLTALRASETLPARIALCTLCGASKCPAVGGLGARSYTVVLKLR